MKGTVEDAETAEEVARDFADENCVGELGDVLDVRRTEDCWIVEFRTHTFSDKYEHRIKIATVGNVFSHDRKYRLDS